MNEIHLRRQFAFQRGARFYLPKKSIVLPSPRIEVSGHFTIWAHSSRGSRLLADFDNLVLNQGLDRLGVGSSASNMFLGTGTVAPAVTDTSLTTSVVTSNTGIGGNTSTYVAGPPPYHEFLRTVRFAAGSATGTWSEIGIGWSTTPTNLFAKALIVDIGGSPTTITVLSDEALDCSYRFRMYIPAGDTTGTLTLSGTPYTWTMRASQSSSPASWDATTLLGSGIVNGSNPNSSFVYGTGAVLGAITGFPTGGTGVSMAPSDVSAAYTNGDYYRIVNRTLALGSANVSGGIKAMQCGFNVTQWQILFGTIIPKDNTRVMTFSQRVTWARRP